MVYDDVGNKTVHTVRGLHLATCYNFNVMASNNMGHSSYMREHLRACALSKLIDSRFVLINRLRGKREIKILNFIGEGPPSLPSRGEVSNDEVNKLPFAVGLVVAFILIVLNVTVVGFCIVRRSKNKFKGKKSAKGVDNFKFKKINILLCI